MAAEADFALQWLNYLGIKIYNNGKQVFGYPGVPRYTISKLPCKIRVGETIGEEDDMGRYTRMAYPDFENLGYVVVTGKDFVWRPGQRCYYKVARKAVNVVGITDASFRRTRMVIQHDPIKRRIRLIGDSVLADPSLPVHSGIGRWVTYDADRPIQTQYTKSKPMTKDEYRAVVLNNLYGNQTQSDTYEEIKEIPMIISDEKYVVCMRKHGTCQRIIVVGMSGQGKSTLVNALSGRIFYMWEDRVGWMIDIINQFHDLSLPQDHNPFIKMNSIIGNEPKPLPAVQLYLACRHRIDIAHPNISLKVSLNFAEFLKKYKFYTFGIRDYDVGDTIRYLMDFYNDLKSIKSAEELEDIMMERIPNAENDKGMQSMIYKWKNTFDTLFKEKFTSNVYDEDETAHTLEVVYSDGRKTSGHPFIMCMEAGLVPVFNISAARRQRWLRNYLADLMQKIVVHQISMGEQRHRMWVIADELNEIYELGKKRDNASAAFEELYRQGRYNNIGFIGNTQSLEKLNPEMVKNATHICCVRIQDKSERKKIGELFGLDKEVYEMLGNLKVQEVMVLSGEPFIIYDRWGRKRVSDRKWFKGQILPPINTHKVPGVGGG